MMGINVVEALGQDLYQGLRRLVQAPGFTAIAVLTLALGIGANTAIFTLIDRVLLNPLPGVDTRSVVALYTTDRKNTGGFSTYLPTSYLNGRDYREMNDVFADLAMTRYSGVTLTAHNAATPLVAELVNWNYFRILGVRPHPGRGFLPEEDDRPDADPVTVLSYGLWQRQFGGDPSLIGQTITLNRLPFTVVGITPRGFTGQSALFGTALWIPLAMHGEIFGIEKPIDWFTERRGLSMSMIGRLKPGVTEQQALASMQALARHLETEFPRDNAGRSVTLMSLVSAAVNPNIRGLFVKAGLLLEGAVALILLIACANVANLLLAKGARRQREMATRLALGASRGRVAAQLLAESLVLALAAGVGGVVIAIWMGHVLAALHAPFMGASPAAIALNGHLLLIALAVAMATGLIFGCAPARQAARADLMLSLRDRAGAALPLNRWFSLRNGLIMAQVALSVVALVGAGLFLRSLGDLARVDPGFDIRHVAVVPLSLSAAGYDAARAEQFFRQAVARAEGLPQVEAASVGVNAPFGGGMGRTVFPEGVDMNDPRSGKLILVDPVSPGFFRTLQIGLVEGRAFTDADTATSSAVAVINQTLTRRLWPNQSAVGRYFRFFGESGSVRVVGVVRDSKYLTLGEDPQPYIYRPLDQQISPDATLYVRMTGNPGAALGMLRGMLHALDPRVPPRGMETMPQVMADALAGPRLLAELLGAFGALALALAVMGIYGIMSYTVSQRTHELGVRMALGAPGRAVERLVVGQGMRVVMAGAAIGLALAAVLTRFLSALLFGLTPHDPATYAGAAAILLAAGLAACFFPARRAARVDPVVALRAE